MAGEPDGNVTRVTKSVAAIVLAGGSGSRVDGDTNKVYSSVGDKPMLSYSLETLEGSSTVARVVLVVREEDRSGAEQLVEGMSTPIQIVEGGPSRHLSEAAGLAAFRREIEAGAIDLVAIHDGARPFMSQMLLQSVVDAAVANGGAVPGLPVPEPIYEIDGVGVKLLDAADIRKVQTPQAFRAGQLLAAFDAASSAGFEGVDTAETVERFSDLRVVVVPGDPRNIKITFGDDLQTAGEYAADWREGGWAR